MNNITKVNYNNKEYAVLNVRYKKTNLPVVLDIEDYDNIQNLNKRWKYHNSGLICCSHTYENKSKDIFIHNILMILKSHDLKEPAQETSIIHLNRIGLDNRRDNLFYNTNNKTINKNIKKKKRTINLLDKNIDSSKLPTYVWYLKENGTHGERFSVNIGDIKWKTTSSKKVSLLEKLELAKDYLKNLKKTNPEYFLTFSMNGDLNKQGYELKKSFIDIIKKAGYINVQEICTLQNITDSILN